MTVPESTRPLTPRERDVLEHAALGMSNRQIGEQLSIAEQTVKNHLSSAMKKLALHSRGQAVVLALGSGLISLPVANESDVEHHTIPRGSRR